MRHIQQPMIDFLDLRLKDNGLAQHAIQTGNARLLIVEAAKVCVGIREKTGNNDGPMVELIQETVDGKAQREAWCMAFVQTMLSYAELKTNKISMLFSSEHCMTTWRNTPQDLRVKGIPLPGAFALWRHWENGAPTDKGHTGIVIAADNEVFHTIEGNTTNGLGPNGEIIREGGGVYYNVRNRLGNGDMRVVGFLKPFPSMMT